jgi:hypothetical protein
VGRVRSASPTDRAVHEHRSVGGAWRRSCYVFGIRTVLGLAFAGIVAASACSPSQSPSDADEGASTGGAAGLGATGGVSGTPSSGGTGAPSGGVASGTGGAGAPGGATSTGGAGGTAAGVAGSAVTGGAGSPSGGAGSSGGSGGSTMAGASGAGSGGAPSGPCGHPGEVFCEDFEDVTTLDPARWVVERIGEGTAVIDTTIAHSGTKSVHATQIGYNAFATLKGSGIFPAGSRFFVRVFMRLAAPMTGGHNSYFIAGLAAQPGAPFETRVGVQNEMLVINQPDGDRGFMSNQNFYVDHLPGEKLAVNAWSCVEVFFDPPNDTISVWLDDVSIPDLHRTDWQQETFDVVRFGFERYAGPDAEVWYDDIAVGTQQLGCR